MLFSDYILFIFDRQMEAVREEQAREKTKIRKDYDLMSSQLADMLKDEALTKRILHVRIFI